MFTDYVDSLTSDRAIASLAPAANLDGWSLEAELMEGEFSEAAIWQILQDILPILQDLHDRYDIHGDIKPANIVRQRGDRRLVLVPSNPTSTPTTPTLKGSVEYAAPEQLYGEVDASSDLYSLGMTCLHLLTQLPPFDLIDRRADAAWRDYVSQPMSAGLQMILNKLVDPAPHKRYPSAAAVLQEVAVLSPLTKNFSEGLSAETIATLSAAITSTAIPAVTVFDPATQYWYRLSREPKISDTTQKIALFLSSRQAAATVSQPEVKPSRDRYSTSKQLVLPSLIAGMGTVIGCFAGILPLHLPQHYCFRPDPASPTQYLPINPIPNP